MKIIDYLNRDLEADAVYVYKTKGRIDYIKMTEEELKTYALINALDLAELKRKITTLNISN